MRSKEGVTVSGLEINPVNAVHMFLHHLQLAVSFLEATALSEHQVCEQINSGSWTGMSDRMVKFADIVARGCFHAFEWSELDEEEKDNLEDSLFIPGVKVFTLDPNDPDAAKKLHEMLGQIFGQ